MTHWYCIHTKKGQEDIICRKLSKYEDIELFNPKILTKKFLRSKLTEVEEELFPSYIFSRINPFKYYHMINYTRGVRRFVGDQSGIAYKVNEVIIDALKSRIKNGFIFFEESRLQPGEKVFIKDGPFKGVEALFLRETNSTERVVILLNAIESDARIELPKRYIGKI
jgi:transcriptional antiterminator RfaH